MIKKSVDDLKSQKVEYQQLMDNYETAQAESKSLKKQLDDHINEINKSREHFMKERQEIESKLSLAIQFNETLKKSLSDKETENIQLKGQLTDLLSIKYDETIQSLKEKCSQLESELQEKTHQLVLEKVRSESLLQVERIKVNIFQEQIQSFRLTQVDHLNPTPKLPLKKRGRPKKNAVEGVQLDQPLLMAELEQGEILTLQDDHNVLKENLGDEIHLSEQNSVENDLLGDSE